MGYTIPTLSAISGRLSSIAKLLYINAKCLVAKKPWVRRSSGMPSL
jgi:hypothetical protein